MKTRLRRTDENPELFWIEMKHPEYGWILAKPSPMTREEGDKERKSIKSLTPPKRKPGFDFIRKAQFYLDEIDLMNEKLKSASLHGPSKMRIEERKKMFIKYTIQLLGDML